MEGGGRAPSPPPVPASKQAVVAGRPPSPPSQGPANISARPPSPTTVRHPSYRAPAINVRPPSRVPTLVQPREASTLGQPRRWHSSRRGDQRGRRTPYVFRLPSGSGRGRRWAAPLTQPIRPSSSPAPAHLPLVPAAGVSSSGVPPIAATAPEVMMPAATSSDDDGWKAVQGGCRSLGGGGGEDHSGRGAHNAR